MSQIHPQSQPERERILSLLACIHRDGGHHTEHHGIERSCKDAEIGVIKLLDVISQQAQRIAELEKGLEPFAEYGSYWSAPDKYIKPEQPVGEFNGRGFMVSSFPLTHAHCRAAAALLRKQSPLPDSVTPR